MIVKKVVLSHYRNYNQFSLETDSKINIFVGPNAQGKTNLLESIYVLALTKSHRTDHHRELIQWNCEQAHLRCELDKKYGAYSLDLSITQKGKKAKVNGLEQKKLSSSVGVMNVVLFAPEDLDIVKGTPGQRRRFLDMEISQVHPGYMYDLSQYQKVLVQRNNYLKQIHQKTAADPLLNIWNEQMSLFGIKIMKKRQIFIKKLQKWAQQVHESITNHSETLMIRYASSLELPENEEESVLIERYMEKLSQIKEQEIRRGMSLAGPHRDDLLFYINDKEVQTFGSQGQQRTTALSLKLAEIELIHDEVGEYPILLLDDVLSELDRQRQIQLIETFQHNVQTFITTTEIEHIPAERLPDASTFHIRSGSVVS